MQTSILIVGTGAMATLFAARLSGSGAQVTLLGSWAEALDSFNLNGACLVDEKGVERAYPVRAAADPSGCGKFQYALVLVKSWATLRAAEALSECLLLDGVVLTLQNGLGNREVLARVLGQQRVAVGVTTSGATLLGPGRASVGGYGNVTVEYVARLEPLITSLRLAGFPVEVVADASTLLWRKLAINAAVNPLTALLRVPNGKLLEKSEARDLMVELVTEVVGVAQRKGVELAYSEVLEAVFEVIKKTAHNHSSMWQDVQRGRMTEIDAICGEVTRAGRSLGIPTPVNETMWRLVSAIQPG